MVGDAGVGKTNMIYVYDKGRKPLAANPTIGVEFTSKTIRLPDTRKVRVQIWDTAGQEQFRAVTMRYEHILNQSLPRSRGRFDRLRYN